MVLKWLCRACGALNPETRDRCWQCRTARSQIATSWSLVDETAVQVGNAPWPTMPEPEDEGADPIRTGYGAVFAVLNAWAFLGRDPALPAATATDPEEIKRLSAWARLRVFALTLLAFLIVTGLFISGSRGSGLAQLEILVVVLLVHELGHFAGMYLFDYKNLRMFFIPLFGAAVSGLSLKATVAQEAVVFLLGPLPGLAIGCACGLAYLVTHVPVWWDLAEVFVVLNGLNLLPIYPLDGGQFVQLMFSGRSARFDTLFQAGLSLGAFLAGLLLSVQWNMPAGIGVAVMAFTIGSLARIRRTHALNETVHAARSRGRTRQERIDGVISPRSAMWLVDMLRCDVAQTSSPRHLAEYVVHVWRRANARRPGVGQRAILLFMYCAGIGVFLAGWLLYAYGLIK